VNQTLFSVQGYVRLADRLSTGRPGKVYDVGTAPECNLKLTVSSEEVFEDQTGQRLQLGSMDTGKTALLSITLKQWNPVNMALGLHGLKVAIATGTVTGETFPTGLVVGDKIALEHPHASSLVITDSAGTPATVSAGSYLQQGHNAHILEVLGLGAYVQPWKAAYSYLGVDQMQIFKQRPTEKYVIIDGVNTEDNDEPILIDLYRAKFKPFSDLSLINKGYGELKLEAAVLYDPLNAALSNLGGFGRMVTKT
jgi:hypothetical protein